eukprot:781689_1
MAKSPSRKVRKKSKKRAHRKSKENRRRKRKRSRTHSGDGRGALSGVGARLLGVGAFAFALWFKRKQIRESAVTTSSQLPSPDSRSSSHDDSNSPENESSKLFTVDMCGLTKPLNKLDSTELRQIASSNLCRIFDEDRCGEKWEEDEDLFVRELERVGVPPIEIATAVNRTKSSIYNRLSLHRDHYTPRANGDIHPKTRYDPPMTWRAESCLMKLPECQGSTKQLREVAEATYNDLDNS